MTFSQTTDCFIRNKIFSTTTMRKVNNLIGTVLPGTFLVLAGYSDCDSMKSVALIAIGMLFFGAAYAGFNCNHLDLAPNYAGILYGITNGCAILSGLISPVVVSYITEPDKHSFVLWQKVFLLIAAIGWTGGVCFLLIGSGELQPWATETTEEEQERSPLITAKTCE